MVQRIAALFCSLDHQHEALLDLFLAMKLIKVWWTQRYIERRFRRIGRLIVEGFAQVIGMMSVRIVCCK